MGEQLLALLQELGINAGPIDELLHIVHPMIELAVGVITSDPLALNLEGAFHTIMGCVGQLGEWLRTYVVSGLVERAKGMIQKVRELFQAEAYIPGLSELYGMVHFGLGEPPRLSIQTALTSAVAYFVNVSYSVATGSELHVPKSDLIDWIGGLPTFPSAQETLAHFSDVRDFVRSGGTGAAPSIERLLGGKKLPALPESAAFAADMILSHVEFVAIMLGGGETIAFTVVSGLLNGTCSLLRSLLHAADILASSYSGPRLALETTIAYFEYTGLGRALLTCIAEARETKELSKVSVSPNSTEIRKP